MTKKSNIKSNYTQLYKIKRHAYFLFYNESYTFVYLLLKNDKYDI